MRCLEIAMAALLGGAAWVSTAEAGDARGQLNVDSLMVEAQAAIGAGRYETAARQLNMVLARESARPDARFQLAVAYRGLGRLHSARRHFRLALSSNAGDAHWVARCRSEIGRTWEQAGDTREALAEYRLALRSDPACRDAEAGCARIAAAPVE
jgi:Tfp pilus assembly protein PilF